MNKVLVLEKRGCDFYKGCKEEKLSDVGNFRVGSYNNSIEGKDGKNYSIEFGGYDKYKYRTMSKSGKKLLKHPVKELDIENKLIARTSFESDDGYTYGNSQLEKEISNMDLHYTLSDILKAINYISKYTYTNIVFK